MSTEEEKDLEFAHRMEELKGFLESDNEKVGEFWRIYYNNVKRVAAENNIELDTHVKTEFEGQVKEKDELVGQTDSAESLESPSFFQNIWRFRFWRT